MSGLGRTTTWVNGIGISLRRQEVVRQPHRYPGAYLAFGDTYAEDRVTALALGWPTATITGRHLHQLHQPDVVAERILALAR